ncbi:hypothetical protein F4806DRAFT_271976 [Annulohypoxylon nitens]|nr:hypothetical protein F4806DRAFT_271976 [Annulohypoxylon nitens]
MNINRDTRFPLLGHEDLVGKWDPEKLTQLSAIEAQRGRVRMTPCSVCGEDVPDTESALLSCRHVHCTNCVAANAHMAFVTKPFAPAKCCHVIPVEVLTYCKVFSFKEMNTYVDLMEEYTAPGHKLYCHDADCNSFIPRDFRRKRIGQCPKCNKNTCKCCGKKSHFAPCDPEHRNAVYNFDPVMKLASERGWKQCPNCRTLVERNDGCGHMTCHCSQKFCYRCGLALGMDEWTHDLRECPNKAGAHF